MLINTYESIKEYLWYESKCPVCEIADFSRSKGSNTRRDSEITLKAREGRLFKVVNCIRNSEVLSRNFDEVSRKFGALGTYQSLILPKGWNEATFDIRETNI